MSYSAHLVSLNFVHQVAECWQAAEADHGLALLAAQPFHLGQGHPRQDDLFTSQEVLELGVVRQLAGGKVRFQRLRRQIYLRTNQPWKLLQRRPAVVASYLGMPLRLIFAKSMAKVT